MAVGTKAGTRGIKPGDMVVRLMLSVRYGSDVPISLAEVVEHHARSAGLSLGALEIIGASLDFVEAFIVASEEGRGLEWARDMNLAPPPGNLARARWVASKVLG